MTDEQLREVDLEAFHPVELETLNAVEQTQVHDGMRELRGLIVGVPVIRAEPLRDEKSELVAVRYYWKDSGGQSMNARTVRLANGSWQTTIGVPPPRRPA